MPELPEVETVRRELVGWLSGRTVRQVKRVDAPSGPKYAQLERAAGQRIETARRRGKFLLLPLSGGDELIIHLGMTGVISHRQPTGHLRIVIELDGRAKRRLYFQDVRRFGRMLVVVAGDYRVLPTLHRMGPEPLSPSFTATAFHEALQKSRSATKTLLLSQRPVAGCGNIYADEALWRARVHPRTPANQISKRKAATLHRAIVDVLRAAIEAQGTTLNDYRTVEGGLGAYVEQLLVYGHDGAPCRRCSSLLQKIVLSGRGTHFCGRCQRL